MPYVTTRGIVLRCTDYSETSQVLALITPDLGQVHTLARGARKPGKRQRKMPLEILTCYDLVIAERRKGQLHPLAEWAMREAFPLLRTDLAMMWTGYYACEVVLATTSETSEDAAAFDCLLGLLRNMRQASGCSPVLFRFLACALRVAGCAPAIGCCAHCNGALHGSTRFSPAAGGALCGDCGRGDPHAFSISRGALAAWHALLERSRASSGLRVTDAQMMEIQRAFNEQIQYHLGRPLRTQRFFDVFHGAGDV